METNNCQIIPQIAQPNLYQRLTRFYAEIGTLTKSSKHPMGYCYIPSGAVFERVREMLAGCGIVFTANVVGLEIEPTNYNGKPGERVRLKMRFALINADNPDEREIFEEWPGVASDNYDMAIKKALTAATKSFLLGNFLLSEGENPGEVNPGSKPQSAAPPPTPPSPPNPVIPTTEHPRDKLVAEFKMMRDAEKDLGIKSEELTRKQVESMPNADLENAIGLCRSRLLKEIQALEAHCYDEFGIPATPKNDLWENENADLVTHARKLVNKLSAHGGKNATAIS